MWPHSTPLERPGNEADGKTAERRDGAGQRIIADREEDFPENQRGRRAIQKKSYHSSIWPMTDVKTAFLTPFVFAGTCRYSLPLLIPMSPEEH